MNRLGDALVGCDRLLAARQTTSEARPQLLDMPTGQLHDHERNMQPSEPLSSRRFVTVARIRLARRPCAV
jgi:hypothetical protein